METDNKSVNLEETRERYCKYLGGSKPLREVISLEGVSDTELVQALINFYEKSSKQVTKERTLIYQKILKVNPKSIKIEKSKKRWGSCNTRKEITFNYLIVMLPMELIDYIVVHELCHIHHMNHDRSFWRKVGSIIPDYKKKIEMLERTEEYLSGN